MVDKEKFARAISSIKEAVKTGPDGISWDDVLVEWHRCDPRVRDWQDLMCEKLLEVEKCITNKAMCW